MSLASVLNGENMRFRPAIFNRLKAWFHDGENRREKLCPRNTDGCTWVILLNFPTLFAFAVSRMNLYSLAKRTFFSRNLICLHHACVQLFRAKIFAFREEKTLVESGLHTCSVLFKMAQKTCHSTANTLLFTNMPKLRL